MACLIFKESDNIERTIDEIKYQTPDKYIDDIIILDKSLNQAAEINKIARTTTHQDIVYFNNYGKASELLFEEIILLLHNNKTSLISPRIYDFDPDLWMSLPDYYERINFRNDISLYNKISYTQQLLVESPIISKECVFFDREHFVEIGGLIEDIDGYEITELSLRNWSYGHKCLIDHKVSYSTINQIKYDMTSAAIVSALWLGKYHEFGNIIRYDKVIKDNALIEGDDLFIRINPELIGYNRIKNAARGKTIGIICDGPSIDYINYREIFDVNDILIGVDLASDLMKCDYVVSFNYNYIDSILNKYEHTKILTPHVLYNMIGKTVAETSSISSEITQFELASQSCSLSNKYPIINSGHPIHSSIHLALLMNPLKINIYGADFKFVAGKSHTERIPIYNNGMYYPDNDTTLSTYNRYEAMLTYLASLSSSVGIPVIRHTHI
jgi:hypothetical protein